MAVYTKVDEQTLEEFLSTYPVGKLVDFSGITDGIENTNYFVTTDDGQFVLTLFEIVGAKELPYFLGLMAYMSEHGIPCAHPVADKHGTTLNVLEDRPAALVQRLRGSSIHDVSVRHCAAVGQALGKLHSAGLGFPHDQDDIRGAPWREQVAAKLYGVMGSADTALLKDEMNYQSKPWTEHVPRGQTHCDLFRDNVLFENGSISGMLDFYYACTDALVYDLAIAVNDWCCAADGTLDETRLEALLSCYVQERQPEASETEFWPAAMRKAALRFWLSRAHDALFPRVGHLTKKKDPEEYRRILCQRRNSGPYLQEIWRDIVYGTVRSAQ